MKRHGQTSIMVGIAIFLIVLGGVFLFLGRGSITGNVVGDNCEVVSVPGDTTEETFDEEVCGDNGCETITKTRTVTRYTAETVCE